MLSDYREDEASDGVRRRDPSTWKRWPCAWRRPPSGTSACLVEYLYTKEGPLSMLTDAESNKNVIHRQRR